MGKGDGRRSRLAPLLAPRGPHCMFLTDMRRPQRPTAQVLGPAPSGGEWQTVGLTDIRREEVRVASSYQQLLSWLGSGDSLQPEAPPERRRIAGQAAALTPQQPPRQRAGCERITAGFSFTRCRAMYAARSRAVLRGLLAMKKGLILLIFCKTALQVAGCLQQRYLRQRLGPSGARWGGGAHLSGPQQQLAE